MSRQSVQRPTRSLPSKQDIDEIIAGDTEKLVEMARDIGEYLATGSKKERLSTSQIRNVFGEVKRLQMKGFSEHTAHELILLKPKLAYQKGRFVRDGSAEKVAYLADTLTMAIDAIQGNAQRFEHFVDFFEAILAYHKAHGGE